MIRLCCLAETLNQLNKEEATALSLNNDNYLDLLRVLPWVYPGKSWYEIVQTQLLSGIPPRYVIQSHLDREKLTFVKCNRIKKYKNYPQAYIINGHQTHDEEWYTTALVGFCETILYALQTGECPLQPDEAPYEYKMWWIHELTRNNLYIMDAIVRKLDTSLHETVQVVASLPYLDKAVLVDKYDQSFSITKGEYLKNFDGYSYYNTSRTYIAEHIHSNKIPDTCKQYEDVYYAHEGEVDIIYDLLFRCNMHGHMNQSLVNGDYAFAFY